jgi:hypothetical protein
MFTGCLRTLSRKFVLALVVAGLPLTVVPTAKAAPGSAKPISAAKDPVIELFDSANKLFAEKKYDAALLLFRKAYEQSQSPNAHLMIGKCLLALNRLPEAYDELSATMREAAKRAESEAKYANARDAAATELAPLEAKIGKVVITAIGAPVDVRVRLGGVELAKEKLGTPVAVMPGTVEIVAEGFPQGTVTRREEVKGGETKAVTFGTETQLSTPKTMRPPSETPVSNEMSGGGVRKAGFAVLGLGVVGMGLFAFGGIQGNSKFATLEKECGTARCTDPKYADVIESGKTMDVLANIGLGVGAAGLIAGTIMVIVGGPKPKSKQTNASMFVGLGQTMFHVRHAF